MDKIGIITKVLLLEKEKNELELERFINSDMPIEILTKEIAQKLNNYRNSMANIQTWLELIDSDNNPEKGENEQTK